jgi:hypothetical protein
MPHILQGAHRATPARNYVRLVPKDAPLIEPPQPTPPQPMRANLYTIGPQAQGEFSDQEREHVLVEWRKGQRIDSHYWKWAARYGVKECLIWERPARRDGMMGLGLQLWVLKRGEQIFVATPADLLDTFIPHWKRTTR